MARENSTSIRLRRIDQERIAKIAEVDGLTITGALRRIVEWYEIGLERRKKLQEEIDRLMETDPDAAAALLLKEFGPERVVRQMMEGKG